MEGNFWVTLRAACRNLQIYVVSLQIYQALGFSYKVSQRVMNETMVSSVYEETFY